MLANIQLIRAVAALVVVFEHVDKLMNGLGLHKFGAGGVDIFFVVSGFIMVHTTRTEHPSPGLFMRKRIVRLVPIYWALTLGVFALAVIAPDLLQRTTSDFGSLLKSLAFIPFQRFDGSVFPVLFIGWTLNYEMFFYALFAIGLGFSRYVVGLACTVGALVLLVVIGEATSSRNVIVVFFTDPIILEFAFGIGLALAFARFAPRARASRATAWVLGAIGIAAFVAAIAFQSETHTTRAFSSGIAATILVSIAVWLDASGYSVRWPLALALGNASYAIYLTHPFVTQLVQKATSDMDLNRPVIAAVVAATLAAVCAVGLAVHRCLERPLNGYARRLLRV